MVGMFHGCSNLGTIFASAGFNTTEVTNSNNMFKDCTSLVGGNGTPYNPSIINKSYARIDTPGSPGIYGYFTAKP